MLAKFLIILQALDEHWITTGLFLAWFAICWVITLMAGLRFAEMIGELIVVHCASTTLQITSAGEIPNEE